MFIDRSSNYQSVFLAESLSPLSLASPNPCLPMVLSFPWLSTPTFAFRSPMMSNTSWDGVSSADACSSS